MRPLSQDMQLFFSNMILYNGSKAPFGVLAERVRKVFERKWATAPFGSATRTRRSTAGASACPAAHMHARAWKAAVDHPQTACMSGSSPGVLGSHGDAWGVSIKQKSMWRQEWASAQFCCPRLASQCASSHVARSAADWTSGSIEADRLQKVRQAGLSSHEPRSRSLVQRREWRLLSRRCFPACGA